MKFIIITFILLLPVVAFASDQKTWQLLPSRSFTERECMMCRFSVSLVNYALRTQRGADQVYRIANSFCTLAHIESPLVCSNITKLFNQEVVQVLSYALLTPNQICGYLSNNTCGLYHDPTADWEVNLNVSITLDQDELDKVREIDEQLRMPQKSFRVIHLSDTHTDLKYKEGSVATCGEPLCCRESSSVISVNESKAGYWGSLSNCDVPLRTLESALKVINATMSANDDIDFIFWTGDIQPHDVWDQDKKTALKTYDTVFSKIFEYLPNAQIFPTLGNHEMVPVDQFSPSNLLSIARDSSPEWLYRKLDSFWSHWLPSDTITTITKDGFYAVTLQTGLKIISLNTNFCHNKNFWLYINSTDPGNQLQWLVHELQISELEHEKVFIIGHIPPGTEDCLKVWSKNFNRILRRFYKTIAGQFFGHTHNDEFEIFYDQDGSTVSTKPIKLTKKGKRQNLEQPWKPISVGFIGPSITTFIGLNPAFRVYTIDPNQGYTPVDFETYFMNITAANIQAAAQEPEWMSSGLFSKQFGINDTTPLSMHNLLIEMVHEITSAQEVPEVSALHQIIRPADTYMAPMDTSDSPGHTASKLYKLFRLYNTYSDNYGEAQFDKMTRDQKKAFICRFFTGQAHNSHACKQFIPDSVTSNDIAVV